MQRVPDMMMRYRTPPADPVADVLDWLGRYDWHLDADDENDVCDEIPREQASSSKGVANQQTPTNIQRPRPALHATSGESVLGCPAKGPGRMLRSSNGPRGVGRDQKPPLGGPLQATAAATSSGSTGMQPSLPPRPRRPLGDVCRMDPDKGRGDGGNCCQTEKTNRDVPFFEEEEEEEWDKRQRKSGTVGRLVVYHEGESPKEDVVLRGGGTRRHIVVAGVREGGQAARVGVRAGDRLVSINGQKDFLGLSADEVRDRLDSPCVLVFLGFVGKLQAEVRLTCTDSVCGLSTRQDVVRGSTSAPVRLCEERVFDAGIASLFMAVGGINDDDDDEEERPGVFAPRPQLFELQRSEACGLVRRALRRLEVKELLAKAANAHQATLPTPAQGDEGLPSTLSPNDLMPVSAQVLGPVAAATEPPPPQPTRPLASGSDSAPLEAALHASDLAIWEHETSDALAKALFREDVSPMTDTTVDEGFLGRRKHDGPDAGPRSKIFVATA